MTSELKVEGLQNGLIGPFDLTPPPGSCTAITGPSGSGKSLLLRMIADLDPNQGKVTLGGKPRDAMPATDWRRQVGYVAAESGWWAPHVSEHLPDHDRAAFGALMERLGLKPDLIDAAVLRLSTGEKQRLALLRALLQRPAVLLLDEPTSALDDHSTAQVEDLLRERMAEGTSILLVTHDTDQARRLGHVQLRLAAGRLEAA